jgi:hypothetical protein
MELDDMEDSNEASLEDFPRGTKRKAAEGDSEEDDEESNPGAYQMFAISIEFNLLV